MYYGTLLLTVLTRQLVGGTRRPDLVRSTYQVNMSAFKTLAVGLAEALCEQSDLLDSEAILVDLLRDRVFCIALARCEIEMASQIDDILRSQLATYRGYAVID